MNTRLLDPEHSTYQVISKPSQSAAAAAINPKSDWNYQTISLVILAVMSLLAGIYVARALLFPIALAIVLNLLISPSVRALAKRKVPEWLGALILMTAILAVFAIGVNRLIPPAELWIQSAPQELRKIEHKFSSFRQPIAENSEAGKEVEDMTKLEKDEESVSVEVKQPSVAYTLLFQTMNLVGAVFLTTTLLYFLLAPGDRFLEKMVEAYPAWRDKRAVVELLRGIERGVGRYLLTITLINVGLGTGVGIGMWALGVPNPVLWGVMATLLNYIPYLGAIIGSSIVCVVSLVSFDSVGHAIWPPLLYLSLSGLEGTFVTPTILGKSMSLNPVIILLSLAFWGWLWGVAGALLAVPILAIAKISCDHTPSLKRVGKFLEA